MPSKISLEIVEITALWPNDSLTFTFMKHFQIASQTEHFFKKTFFYLMINLERDKMKAFWPNDSLSFILYETFSSSIPKLTTFVKEVLWFND